METGKVIKKVEKEWGSEEWIVNRDYCGKILNINKGFRCSIHHHKLKDETFYVLEGQVLFELDGKTEILNPGDTAVIQPGEKHRFTGMENSRIIEFSTHHEEEDSYRDVPSGKLNFNDLFDRFKEMNVVVAGDIMLDVFIEGNVNRINPEAPVPVVDITNKYYALGGAANVASNIVSLGGQVSLFGFIGADVEGKIIQNILEQKDIEYYFGKSEDTVNKTRVIGNGQQIVRFDKEKKNKKTFEPELAKILLEKCERADIIIISDYAKGTVTEDLFRILNFHKSKIIVDPKPENKSLYHGVFLVKPNEKEFFSMARSENFEEAGMLLMKELNSHLLVTRGEKGMALFKDRIVEIPTYAREVYDVAGVGDTVSAALALSIAAGASLEVSAIVGNYAAGIAISKKGVYSASLEELRQAVFQNESKIMNLAELKIFVDDMKNKNKRVVWTNGCFDLLHLGHIQYLKEAKKFGDVLIVGLNANDSIRALKGPDRPIQSELERAEILASLGFIDKVIIFSELDCSSYLKELKPNYYVKGGDYNLDSISKAEKEIIENYGGEIRFVQFVTGKSTSNIVSRIKNIKSARVLKNDAETN